MTRVQRNNLLWSALALGFISALVAMVVLFVSGLAR